MTKEKDPTVQKLNDLWNYWFKQPTESSGRKMIEFLLNEKNRSHLKKIADAKPLPHPKIAFAPAYISAVMDLDGWIKDGCDPKAVDAPSEFIADIAKWVNYKI